MTVAARVKVLCVDDNELLAEALRGRLSHEPGIEWVGWVNDGTQVPERVSELKPDVILMDLDLPGFDTLALVQRLAEQLPEVRVVMFSGHVHIADIDRALDCGAWGYLSKNDDVQKLIEGIAQVGRGEIAFSNEVEVVRRCASG